jgi:hypothetical protein
VYVERRDDFEREERGNQAIVSVVAGGRRIVLNGRDFVAEVRPRAAPHARRDVLQARQHMIGRQLERAAE